MIHYEEKEEEEEEENIFWLVFQHRDEKMLMFMIMLIWDDVDVYDNPWRGK